jgi:hypothetical protein
MSQICNLKNTMAAKPDVGQRGTTEDLEREGDCDRIISEGRLSKPLKGYRAMDGLMIG